MNLQQQVDSAAGENELISLIQMKNFDVTGLNEIWLDTQNKHMLAEVTIHG